MEVNIFIPCFIDQLYPNVGFNLVKVLEKAGCKVIYNPNQTCCGQPAFNAGFINESKEVCKKFIKDFENAAYIVVPSASCVGFVKNYYATLFDTSEALQTLAHFSSRIFEVSDFLVNVLQKDDFGAVFYAKATYHDSCAALRECDIQNQPRRLLSKVRGLELIEMEANTTCCGFGGSFAVKFEAISVAMGNQKITNAQNTSGNYIISTDMSCLMHLEGCIEHNAYPMQVLHLVDVLAMF